MIKEYDVFLVGKWYLLFKNDKVLFVVFFLFQKLHAP